MKLVIAIVSHDDADAVIEQLIANGYRVTHIASTGGFLRRGNATLLIGLEQDDVEDVIDVLRATCTSPPKPDQNRATIFVVEASHFEQV